MPVKIEDIQKLRQQTGAGMMTAKAALEAADGDIEKATLELRKSGQIQAAKKSSRVVANGLIESYVHGGRIGVLVEVNCETDFVARTDDFKTFAHDVAMHIAALSPQYVRPEDIPTDIIETEKTIYTEAAGADKPADVTQKIVAGKLEKFYSEVTLLKQPFVKNSEQTVETVMTDLVAKLGENIVIGRFVRYEVGEDDGR